MDPASGNSTTESKTEPTTGTMEDTNGVTTFLTKIVSHWTMKDSESLPSAETTLNSSMIWLPVWKISALLSKLITQIFGTLVITSKTANGTATLTSPMAWELTSTGRKMANQVGGNSTTVSKTEPTTGMMVDTDTAKPGITAKVTKKNIWRLDQSLLTSTEPVMSPSLQFHALMLSLLLKSSEPHLTQPPPSFLALLLLPPVLLPSATSQSRELRPHSSKLFTLEQSFD